MYFWVWVVVPGVNAAELYNVVGVFLKLFSAPSLLLRRLPSFGKNMATQTCILQMHTVEGYAKISKPAKNFETLIQFTEWIELNLHVTHKDSASQDHDNDRPTNLPLAPPNVVDMSLGIVIPGNPYALKSCHMALPLVFQLP